MENGKRNKKELAKIDSRRDFKKRLRRARTVRSLFHTREFVDFRRTTGNQDGYAGKLENQVPIICDAFCETCNVRITTNRCVACELAGRERRVLRLSRKTGAGLIDGHYRRDAGTDNKAAAEFKALDDAGRLPKLGGKKYGTQYERAIKTRISVMRSLKVRHNEIGTVNNFG